MEQENKPEYEVCCIHIDESLCFYVRLDNKLAAAELTLTHIGIWYFSRLIVPKQLRNKNIAGVLIDALISYAKKHNLNIFCDINPYSDNPPYLNFEGLYNFYVRHGFKGADNYVYFGNVDNFLE